MVNRIVSFIRKEHTGDALRNTLATFIPGFTIILFGGHTHAAIAVSVGALLASLTDLPGIRADKWQSAAWCIPFFLIATLLTEVTYTHHWALVTWLAAAAFVCGMLFSSGPRMANIGILTLIVICFTIGLAPRHILDCSLYITTGAIWYYMISLVQVYLLPHRSLHHAMRDSYNSMATLLRAKADLYNENIQVADSYRKISKLHIIVSEQQDHVRSLLLREEKLLKSDNQKGQYLLQQAYSLFDLYELLTAIDHDYDHIRQALDAEHSLTPIRRIIMLLARLIDSLHLPLHTKYLEKERTIELAARSCLEELRQSADIDKAESGKILNATIQNIEEIIDKIISIRRERTQFLAASEAPGPDYTKFIPGGSIGLSTIKAHLTFKSPVFRFSVRLALLFGLGASFGFLIIQSRYSYWLLLTIAIVARPTFAVTQRRNYQRITGTVLGLIVSLLILFLLDNKVILLIIVVVSLFAFFLFNRPNYLISVLFVTIAVLVSLLTFEGASLELFSSRALFTLLGALLALLGWFVVPVRQSKGITGLAEAVVASNAAYFETIKSFLEDDVADLFQMRLYRKEAHTALAVFSEAFHQLQIEPGRKKTDFHRLHDFQTLAYRTNSLIVGISLMMGKNQHPEDLQHLHNRNLHIEELLTALKKYDFIY